MWNSRAAPSFEHVILEIADEGWCAVATRGAGLWRSCLPQPTVAEAVAVLGTGEGRTARDDHPLLEQAAAFVRACFAGEDAPMDLPLDLADHGLFSRAVLMECAHIPRGEVVTYGELAARAGRPGAARAVGQVMRRNPLPLFVPCHRVVGADGRLTGFGGGLELKGRLLRMEGREVEREAEGKWRTAWVRQDERQD